MESFVTEEKDLIVLLLVVEVIQMLNKFLLGGVFIKFFFESLVCEGYGA